MRLAARPYLQSVSIKPDMQPDFDTHPHNVPAVRELGQIDFHPDVTFFVGENGSGKSTVLEGIAVALGFGPEGGTRNVQLLKTVAAACGWADNTPAMPDEEVLRRLLALNRERAAAAR